MNRKTVQDLIDTSVYSARKDRARDPTSDKVYGTYSGADTIAAEGINITGYLIYDHVGTLDVGDIVELDHFRDRKTPTVVGKVLSTRPQVREALFVRKTAGTETVTSSTTLQNDDHIWWNGVAASTTWILDLKALVNSASAVPDFKWGFTFPAGATFWLGQHALTVAPADPPPSGTIDATYNSLGSGAAKAAAAATTTGSAVNIFGVLIMGATAGDVVFQWAQNVSDATGTVLYDGTYATLTRVA